MIAIEIVVLLGLTVALLATAHSLWAWWRCRRAAQRVTAARFLAEVQLREATYVAVREMFRAARNSQRHVP